MESDGKPGGCRTGGNYTAGLLQQCENRDDSKLELVQSVEGGNFVGFGKSGVIEDGVAEILDRSTHGQDSLADVHDFGGAVANDVNAQQFKGLGVEDQFQQALVVAQHLSFRQFGIAGQSDFVGHFFAGKLLFRLADHGNLGDCVNTVGNEIGRHI